MIRKLLSRSAAYLLCLTFFAAATVLAQTDPLPSWNDGAAKQAIVEFVQATTTQGEPEVRPPESASRPSTRTARSGSSTRCTPR